MSELRAGYDVVECVYIEEPTFGTTPTSGTWKPIALVTNFDPRPRTIYKEKIGVGRQLPSKYVRVKRYAEFTINHELLAKETSPEYEWTQIWYYIITNAAYGSTFSLGKRLKTLSIGAKLDLSTDEYWLLKGCMLNRYEIASGGVDQVVTGTIEGVAQLADFSETDYVTGTATRQANPSSDYIKHGDCEITIAGNDIYDSINSWSFVIERTIERKGKNASDGTLYRTFVPTRCDISLRINRDFDSTTELNQFLNDTEFTAVLKIPSESGGRQITLSGGKWQELSSPHREIDLIDLTLTARFTGLSVETIS